MDPEREDGPAGDEGEALSPGGEREGDAIPLEPEAERAPQPPARAEPAREPRPAPERPEEGKPREPRAVGEDEPLVREGLGGAKAALIVGVALLVGAMIASAIRIANLQGATLSDSTLAVFYVLFNVLLHTMTGFAALLIAARLVGRPLGKAELGVSRMFVAVGAFAVVANLTIPIPGRIDEYVLAVVAYALVVWGANRLARVELGVVVAAHALIWIAVALGSVLDGAYAESKSKLGPATARVSTPAPEATP